MKSLARWVLPSLALLGTTVAVATALVPAAAGDSLPTASFAIGDLNATANSPVTFWGAQWWKENQLSNGTAPPAFKGYALTVDSVNCTFTARPGNSSPPPDGPLPPVITVLVTNSVSKSGSTISGNVTGFVKVATNDGYEPNPGHPGTGTVTADDFVPCVAFLL
jgi:hypothetical protein